MSRNRITDPKHIAEFIFAGNATFTVVSSKTGTRFTYKVTQAKGEDDGRPWFVKVLTGSNNEGDYTYAGFIPFDSPAKIIRGRKGRIDASAPSMIALAWVLNAAVNAPDRLGQIEFWHEGRCGCCGRKLTVPESIASGLGPVCAGRVMPESAPPVPAAEDQDADLAQQAEDEAKLLAARQAAADAEDDDGSALDAEEAKELRKAEYLAAVGDKEAIDICEWFYNKQRQ